jgi:hypothetical protein
MKYLLMKITASSALLGYLGGLEKKVKSEEIGTITANDTQ